MNSRNDAEAVPNQASAPGGADLSALRFDGMEFDLLRGELRGRDGAPILLRPKAELLLRAFLNAPGRLLAREALIDALWPSTVVTDDSLVQCVGELRAALGDREQRLIRTVPRRGYRFEGTVVPKGVSAKPAVHASGSGNSGTSDRDDPAELTSDASPLTSAPRRRVFGWVAVAALLGSVILIGAQRWLAKPSEPPQRIDDAVAARHVTVVIPFALADDDPRLREIANRVADQIAAHIATYPGMRAIGRRNTETLTPGDRAPKQLAGTLHAAYAITGRVTAVSGRPGASVDVQVLALPEGAIIGSTRIEAETSVDAATASDIGELVTNLLRGKSGEIEAARLSAPIHVPDATDLTVIGWQEITRMSSDDDVTRARSRFRLALRHDPDSVTALTGLAASYQQARIRGMPMQAEDSGVLEAALDKAMKIAPDDPTVALLWALQRQFDGRPDLAIPSIEKANRLVPSFPNGHLMLGQSLIRVGRLDEARRELDRAIRLALLGNDPRRASRAYMVLAEIALMQRDDERAAQLARRSIATGPSGIWSAYGVLAAAEALSGHRQEAAEDMAVYRSRLPHVTIATYDAVQPSRDPAFLAGRARLYEGLRIAGLPDH